ncbi:MAG: glycosyltransferase family 2 protein [Clostridia bacterium]
MAPYVSVVVPTCGRPDLLKRCLAALERQSLARHAYEIIVVEDAKREGPATARNRGWRQARASIVAFTDDDCVPERSWLAAGLTAMARGYDAVTGRIVMPLSGRPTDYERDAQQLQASEFVTANCFVRRATLERMGGFDERFRLAWREDSDLHFSLLRGGARIGRAPGSVVVHPVRPAGWGVSLKQQRKVMFDALLFKKHPRLYRERIRATPRWDYYAIVLSLLMALLLPYPAGAAALALWFVLSLKFFLARVRGTSAKPLHVTEVLFTSFAIPPIAVFWRIVGALRFRVAFS